MPNKKRTDAVSASNGKTPVRPPGLIQETGRRIVQARKRRGWSQTELAHQLGVKRERVGNWERGENAPRLEELALLGQVLRTSLDELVYGKRRGRRLSEEEIQRGERHLAGLVELLGVALRRPGEGEPPDERPFRGHEGPEVPRR
ncbi:MAG: helix-turn-helix transcriptional regulator [Thermoanaerobaculia bacterium]